MTREDINHALGDLSNKLLHSDDEVVDFALDMARRHNEELALSWERDNGYDKFHVAKFIRELKP